MVMSHRDKAGMKRGYPDCQPEYPPKLLKGSRVTYTECRERAAVYGITCACCILNAMVQCLVCLTTPQVVRGCKILQERNNSPTRSSSRLTSTSALVGHRVKLRTTVREKIQHGGQASCCAVNSGASCSATLFRCQHGAARPQRKNTQITPPFDISLLSTLSLLHLPHTCPPH